MNCMDAGHQGFSLWSMVLITVSHVLLVLNSSINLLIYCFLSSKFREECRGLVKKLRWSPGFIALSPSCLNCILDLHFFSNCL